MASSIERPRVTWSEKLEEESEYAMRKSSLKKKSKKKKKVPAEAWRERGKLYRAKLIMKDEESGGDAFVLSNDCNIEKYYDVAERVLEQFLATTVEDKHKLTEAYLVGNRLVKFMSQVLPTHKDYFSIEPRLNQMRVDCQAQLVELLQYLEELAIIIDEEEYQEFIRLNLSAESYKEQSDASVSSHELAPYAEGEHPMATRQQESHLRRVQEEDSRSWEDAFNSPKRLQQQSAPEQKPRTVEDGSFPVEWRTDFDESRDQGKYGRGDSSRHLLSEGVTDSSAWESQVDSQEDLSWVRYDVSLEKMTLNIPALGSHREDLSPKSVLELPEWKPEDSEDCSSTAPSSVDGNVKERAPPSDDEYSNISGEEELSLTGGIPSRRRRGLKHFQGCVKCLLD